MDSGDLCFLFGAGEGGQEHGGEDGNDGDDDQQFDEGEGAPWRGDAAMKLTRHAEHNITIEIDRNITGGAVKP